MCFLFCPRNRQHINKFDPPPISRTIPEKKKQDSQRRDRILRFFLCPEIGQLSPHFGVISSVNYAENPEKQEKIHRRKFKKKSSGDGTPKLQISVLGVVERVLIITKGVSSLVESLESPKARKSISKCPRNSRKVLRWAKSPIANR